MTSPVVPSLERPSRRHALQQTAALGAAILLSGPLRAEKPTPVPRLLRGWQTIPPLTLAAGSTHSIAQYFVGTGVTFAVTQPLPAGVTLSADGVVSVAAGVSDAVVVGIVFTATDTFSVPPPAPLPVPTPPIIAKGALRLVGQSTMAAATNEVGAAKPLFGKHMATAYRSRERAIYIFGGDGTSWSGVGNNSHTFHFGKLLLGATASAVPVYQHFYPYLGIAGEVVPAGYDCAPFVYDLRRDAFWQIGGYRWGVTAEGWRGIPETGGVWTFAPGSPFGRWTHLTSVLVPESDAEGMQAVYHPRLDMVIGVKNDQAWYYRCADGSTGLVKLGLRDWRDVGRWNALGYDTVNDELLFVTPANQKVVAIGLASFPASASMREIATVPSPYTAYGQFPTVWVADRRELICFYTADKGIQSVNVDSGAIVASEYPQSVAATGGGWITQAVHVPEDASIVGLVAQSSDVATFSWAP